MRRLLLYLIGFLAGVMSLMAQTPEPRFGAPFDFPLYLSGNFGELRSNHFHGGLDSFTVSIYSKVLSTPSILLLV